MEALEGWEKLNDTDRKGSDNLDNGITKRECQSKDASVCVR